jgi:hypothetical protein
MWLYAWGVPNTKENEMTRTNETTTNIRNLPAGAPVVSTLDAEPGRIIKVCTQNRSRTMASSYVVRTDEGREIWDVQDIFLPDAKNGNTRPPTQKENEMTRTKQDNIKTKLDGKKVVITSGRYQHKAGHVLRGQAFIARG